MLPTTSEFSSSNAVIFLKVVFSLLFFPVYCDQVVCLWNDRAPSVHFSDKWTVVSSTSVLRTEKPEVVIKYQYLLMCPPSKTVPKKIFLKQFFFLSIFLNSFSRSFIWILIVDLLSRGVQYFENLARSLYFSSAVQSCIQVGRF